MTDNRLRCALIYRLDGDVEGGSTQPVLLAKYDHASQYESHGSGGGDIYGGKDKNYAEAVGMLLKNNPPAISTSGEAALGGFRVVQSQVHQVVYGRDADGICVAVITGMKYPSRIAIQMLVTLHQQFLSKFNITQLRSATPNSLSSKAKSTLSAVCKQHDDPSKVDKTANLIAKVDEVKSSMQGNIEMMLSNTAKAEGLQTRSEQLTEQAGVFRKNTKELKRQMWWKDMKMTVMLVFVVAAILVIILVPLISKLSAK